MNKAMILSSLISVAGLAFGAPNQKLFDTMVGVATSLGEVERESEIPEKVTDLPIEMQSLFELTADEEDKLKAGQQIYSKKELQDLVQKASESGVFLSVVVVELLNRSDKKGLDPYQQTLAYRLVQAEIKRQTDD